MSSQSPLAALQTSSNTGEIVPGIRLCPRCSRLSTRCVHAGCEGWNRPGARYCVLCGRSQWDREAAYDVAAIWKRAEAAPADWDQFTAQCHRLAEGTSHTVDMPSERGVIGSQAMAVPQGDGIVRVEPVMELDPAQFPRRREKMRFMVAGGVLFLHQGGGGIAAMHAMKSKGTFAAPFWQIRESDCLPVPRGWPGSRSPEIDPCYARPFSPVVSHDLRFVVFSTPYGVAVWPLADLPGWSTGDGRRLPHAVVKLGEQSLPLVTLAARPVLIEHRDSSGNVESAMGLVFARRRSLNDEPEYLWTIIDLSNEGLEAGALTAETLTSSSPPVAVPLPLRGSCCQTELLRGVDATDCRGVLFATPVGLWSASIDFARRRTPFVVTEVLGSQRVSTDPPGTVRQNELDRTMQLAMDADVPQRNRFRWDGVFISPTVSEDADDAQFTVWFWEHAGSQERYLASITLILGRDFSSRVVEPSRKTRAGLPIGLIVHGGTTAHALLSNDDGGLFFHKPGGFVLDQKKAFFTSPGSIVGISLFDDLAVAVRRLVDDSGSVMDKRHTGREMDSITVRSVAHWNSPTWPSESSTRPGPLSRLQLEADPVYWLGHLWLCDGSGPKISLYRVPLSLPATAMCHPNAQPDSAHPSG
jgi:hypothetical protein